MKLWLSMLVLPLVLTAQTRPGGVAFRFDDNQKAETWNELHSIFMKHGFTFSLAVNSSHLNPEQAKILRKVTKNGCEVMDHSPNHSAQHYDVSSKQEADKMKKLPFVDHVSTGTRVYFKVRLNSKDPGQKTVISVKNKMISKFEAKDKDKFYYNAILEFPDGRICGVFPEGGNLKLLDFWECPPENLPDMENVTVIARGRGGYDVHPDATRFLARKSVENHKKLGLPPPKTYIIPGGWGIFNSADVMRNIYIKEFNYKSGDCGRGWDFSMYGDNSSARANMAPCWTSLEVEPVESAKKRIADAVACHKVVIFISHLWPREIPGGVPELLQRNDKLLAWLKEKNVQVHTQAEWSDILFSGKQNPKEEIFPSLTTDLNGDGVPDGFTLGKESVVQGNSVTGNGEILALRQLTGFVRSTNMLTFEAEGPAGTTVHVDLTVYQNPQNAQQISRTFELNGKGKQKIRMDVPLDEKSNVLDCKFRSNQKITLSNISMRLK